MAKTIHTLEVTLREVKPPVWRRIEVPSELQLSELADPRHPEFEMMSEWAPLDFNPASFQIDEATEAMRSSRPMFGW